MPRIVVKYEGKATVYDQAEDVTTIGRNEGNRLHLQDPTVSDTHCRIEKVEGGFVLVDLGGKNGTRVNGVRVVRHTLKSGDSIQIGATTLVFQGSETKAGAPAPAGKRLLVSGQEERFILDVATGKDAGKRFVLTREEATIGRDAQCDLALSDQTASRVHACVICTPTEFVIEDQKTRNGTLVNGQKISQRCPLKHGDEIRVGHTRIVFRDLQSLAHRVETVALSVSRAPEGGLRPAEELPPATGRDFMRQLAERRRARRRLQVVIGVVALIVACAVGFYYARKYGLFAQKAGFVAVNLLKQNPSFETGLVDKLPKGWSFGKESEARWRAATLPGGGTCLDLEGAPASDPNSWAEAVCGEEVKAAAGKRYQVSMKVRSEGPKGTALIKVSWLKDAASSRPVLESYSPPSWGAHDWQWLTGVFTAPDGATAFQVSCIGVGNSQPLFFDDLTVYEGLVGEETPGILRADVDGVRACMNPKGLFSVSAGQKVIMTNGEGRIEGAPDGPLMRQAFASLDAGFPEVAAPGWYNFSTRLVDTATMTLVNLRETTNAIKGGFWAITYTVIGDPTQARPVKWVGTSFMLPSEVVERGIGVGSGIETLTKTGEFKQAEAACLVIGKGSERLVIDFTIPQQLVQAQMLVPFTLECKRQGDDYLATLSMPLDVIEPMQRVEWSLTFGKLSGVLAKNFIVQARSAAVNGEKVAALNAYQKFVACDLCAEDGKQVAQGEIKQIEDSIEKLIVPVKEEVDKAIRMADQDELKVAEIDVKELYDKFGATRPGAKIATLRQQIDDFRQGKVVKAEGDVVELLKKAQSNFEKEGWMVAKVFAENVIRKGGPNTIQAKDAQKLLDAIPKAREEAKARDEYVNKKLASATTFEKNNMPAKAVLIYEEILQKYPKSKWTAEITKRLAETKKKAGRK